MGQELLRVEGLRKSYDGTVNAIENVSFSVGKGEVVSVIGSSGAGKSTLLRCINSLVTPSEGKITFEGQDVCCLKGAQLRGFRRRVSMIFQHYNLVNRSTAIENVLHGRLGYKSSLAGCLGLYSKDERQLAFDALKQVGLEDYAYARADQLSGGQKQRVGIARALVQQPLLILADEPIASLDPKSSRGVLEQLRWAADERGIACLVSLHQVEYARRYSDRIVAVAGGSIVFDGSPDQLTDELVARVYGSEEPGQTVTERC